MNGTMKSIFAVVLCVLMAEGMAQAQKAAEAESHPVDVAVMFHAERSQYSYASSFWMYGGSGEIAANIKYNLGLAVNVTGDTRQGSSGENSLSKVMTTSGPRYTLPLPHRRSDLFLEALFGGVHGFDSIYPANGAALHSASAFAMQLGGGCNVRLNTTWAVRAIDVHYVRTDLPNGFSDRQQDLQIGAGIVWRPLNIRR